MASWHVRLFGQFECRSGEFPCNLPASAKAHNLLAYLFLHQDRAFSRSVLAELISPDLPEVQAHHALSQALWQIRRSLPGLLACDTDQVGIANPADVWVDMLEFQALAERFLVPLEQPAPRLTDIQNGIDLYRGDLLEGYYTEWALVERERLRDIYLQMLERLVLAYKASMQYQQALNTALRLVNADPLNESAHREVMRLYHYLGRPAEALRQYNTCCDILRREFDLNPESETGQIAEVIAQRSGFVVSPHLPEPSPVAGGSRIASPALFSIPLIGRSTERVCLLDWLRQNQSGGSRLILVEGEAGVGKTRLLQEVARDMEWHGAQVIWGKAMPLAARRPLEPLTAALESGLTPLRVEQLQHMLEPVWLQVLQPLLPRMAHHLPEMDPLPELGGLQEQIRLFEGLVHLLAAWASINPLVIFLEDIHWAAADSVDLLASLSFRLEPDPISLVLSYRSEELAGLSELSARFSTLRPEAVRGRLALNNLDAAAVDELVRASLGPGEVSAPFKEALIRETHGNPLFILEILHSLYDEGVLGKTEADAWVTPYDSTMGEVNLPLPPKVEQVIIHRLDQLPAELRHLLEGLAVLGTEFDFERVACLGLGDARDLVLWLQALCKRRLLTEYPQTYRFSHDKIRQVVYESLSETQRIAWHTRLAAALEQAHPDQVEALAYHYTQAHAWGKAVEYHWQSSKKAQRANAYAASREHLDIALSLADQARLPAEDRFRMLEMHVIIVGVLGNTRLWQNDLDAMARLAGNDPRRLAITRQQQIMILMQTSHYVEAETTARQALKLAEDLGDHSFQATALTLLGNILDVYSDPQAATAYLERAIHIFQQLGDRQGEAEARSRLANVLAKSEQRAAARAEFETVLSLYQAINYQPGCADTQAVLGVLSDFDGEWETSIELFNRSLEICRAIGYRMGEAYASHGMGSVLYKLGKIGQSFRYLQDTLGICLAIGEQRIEVVARIFLSNIEYSAIGDYAAAIQQAEAGLATASAFADPVVEGMCYTYLADALLKSGDADTARVQAGRALGIFQTNHIDLRLPEVYLSMAKIDLACGHPAAAFENLEKADVYIRKYNLEVYIDPFLHLRSETLLALEKPEEALACLDQVFSIPKPVQDQQYRSFYLKYKILDRLGRLAESRQSLERAYNGLTKMLAGLSPEQQEMSRRQVPDHCQLLEIWQASQPRRVEMRLPHVAAPLGGASKPDKWVVVQWTVAAPEDDAVQGKMARRRLRLRRLLQEAKACGGAPTSEHLALALGVSVRTIASDLAALEAEYG